jgi:hypothetical protein
MCPPVKVVNIPEVNVDAEAEIGQSIISSANLSSRAFAVLADDVSEYKKAELLNNRWSGTTRLRAGALAKEAENAEGHSSGTRGLRLVFQAERSVPMWRVRS